MPRPSPLGPLGNGSGHDLDGMAHMSAEPPPADGVAVLRVLKQGMLTKLSKGGFTANWNRASARESNPRPFTAESG